MNDRPPTFESAPQDQDAIKIAGLYLLLGSLWILFSDQLLLLLTRDPALFSRISLFKGWGYIIVTALLLYWLIRRRNAGLHESEARYRSLFQNNHSVMLLIEPETGTIVDANPAACNFYGYTHPEITSLRITDINQLTPEQIFAEMEQARREQRRQFFFRHRLANGNVREVEVYSGPIEFHGKTLLYSIVHDVTERKRIQESLHRSERTLQLFVEYAPAAIAMFDRNMIYLAVSHRYLTDYHLKEQNLVGRSHYDIFPEMPERWKEIHRRCLAGAVEMCAEDPFPRADGTLDWVHWEIHPWYEHDAEIGGIILFSEVITERKRAEQEIQSLARFPTENPNPVLRVSGDGRLLYANTASTSLLTLWHCQPGKFVPPDWQDYIATAVATQTQHTVEVTCGEAVYSILIVPVQSANYANLYGRDISERKQAEADLRRTMEELKRSNADLEQFAYVASHDLQEPLRAVAGTVQLLQKRYGGQLDARADEFIRHAVEGAARMQTLINDLLAYSRVGTRGQPFQPVDSASALADTLANLTVAIRESGAVIRHDSLPTVIADRTQLVQLFQNLLANAIKFRSDRVPDIQIRVERREVEWLFAVADNGIGLEAEYYERIFGVFQRLHTRREYSGTGIGLALCKKIIERHGGRIWVESQPGQGSTFYFTLPERENSEQ